MKAALLTLQYEEAYDDDKVTTLSTLVRMGTTGEATYKGVALTRVEQGATFFNVQRVNYVRKGPTAVSTGSALTKLLACLM